MELPVVMPAFFYNKVRLIKAFAEEKGNKVDIANHSMKKSFSDSLNQVRVEPGNEYGTAQIGV